MIVSSESRCVERGFEFANLTVISRSGHDRRTGVRLGQRDASVQFERSRIVDRASSRSHAAVTVTRVSSRQRSAMRTSSSPNRSRSVRQRHLRDALRVQAPLPSSSSPTNAKEDDATDADADHTLASLRESRSCAETGRATNVISPRLAHPSATKECATKSSGRASLGRRGAEVLVCVEDERGRSVGNTSPA